jgi:hypothetical protein
LGFKAPQKLNSLQKFSHQIFKAKNRLILLNLSDDILLYGAYRFLGFPFGFALGLDFALAFGFALAFDCFPRGLTAGAGAAG